MKSPTLLLVPFHEVRHEQADDCLHYESVAIRGEEMDWTIPMHRHDGLHQFQLLEHGTVHGSIDGREFDAVAPAMLMLAPGSVHGFTYSRDARGHQLTVPTATLHKLMAGSSLAAAELGESFMMQELDEECLEECQLLFRRVAREFRESRPGRVQALLACATLLVVRLFRSRADLFLREKGVGIRDTLVQRYLTLAEQHFLDHRPLSFYAETLGVTPDHLSRSCRKLTKQSALQLLHDRLMLEARRLLVYSAMPVSQVAQQLGYADPAYFSKFFSNYVGSTPSDYRALVARGVRGGVDVP
ncbi:helix-turn-helix domain-containing protein [Variovorax saccharolyticus]|uniref:helix-turn-helix domain-containing protein n=1 Tax=Variovorax saccharolyticus TaxID=3053516 RepID=UPI002575605D|nr:helix-turn-helix domain-containing protein [Variovorax sp. J31P216]MDM0028363.1 helix-turn-helix domain-containing protein [Variovorax sp. J31P216]